MCSPVVLDKSRATSNGLSSVLAVSGSDRAVVVNTVGVVGVVGRLATDQSILLVVVMDGETHALGLDLPMTSDKHGTEDWFGKEIELDESLALFEHSECHWIYVQSRRRLLHCPRG